MQRTIHQRTLAFGSSVVVSVTSDDAPAGLWLEEYLRPWFAPSSAPADWQVRLSSSADAYAAARASRPPVTVPRPCFAFDTYVLSLDSWQSGDRLIIEDSERSCVLSFGPYQVDLVADPGTDRWRFTAALLLLEIASTRMRRVALDLHAAAVATEGGGLAMIGPKGAGKTTLLFHLLRSGWCRMLANDRTFALPGHPSPRLFGAPTAIKIRPATVATFPELRSGLPLVERPYLKSLAELAGTLDARPVESSAELALSPPQVLRQLGVEAEASSPLAAIAFVRLDADLETWAIEPLDAAAVRAGLKANHYGNASGRESETVIEEIDGGRVIPGSQAFEQVAGSVPGYRLRLGPAAYAAGDLVARLLQLAVVRR